MWRGQAEAPLLVLGERRTPEYSVSGTSGRTPLSRAYLAGGWYWHRQPSYRGPFISVWTCGLGPNPGRSRRARRQLRGWGVVAQRRNPALLLSSGAPPSIPAFPPRLLCSCASLPRLLACCQSLSLYLRPTHPSCWFTKMLVMLGSEMLSNVRNLKRWRSFCSFLRRGDTKTTVWLQN